MKHCFIKFTVLCTLFFTWGCAALSNRSVSKSDKTTVVFLIDGLGVDSLKAALKQYPMSGFRRHFNIDNESFQLARATFPTLTYPNITSLLTTRAVDGHPIIGNQVVIGHRKIDFQLPLNLALLNKSVEPFSIFQKLKDQNLTSASFSYLFGQNATDHIAPNLSYSIEYQFKEYSHLDQKLIDSLVSFLKQNPASGWPRFIYVHLIGFDGHAHLYGPNSEKSLSYLSRLDSSLDKAFSILESGDRLGHPVETILTSDHGFVDSNSYVDIDNLINSLDHDILTLNEQRFLTIHKPSRLSDEELTKKLEPISTVSGVDMIAQRLEDSIVVKSPSQNFEIKYGPKLCSKYSYSIKVGSSSRFQCPDFFDQGAESSAFPYLITNLANYFKSPIRPDAIVVAKAGYGFTRSAKGNHGGLSKEEVLVPLLTRNISFGLKIQIVKTSELLLGIF